MTSVTCDVFSTFCRRYSYGILALCRLSGIVCGVFLFLKAGPSSFLMMRRVIETPVSIVGLLSNLLFPFLITVYSVFIFSSWLIFAVCFLDGVLLSWFAAGISVAFSSAGWLLCSFLLFHSNCCFIGAYLVWSCLLSGERKIGRFFCWGLIASAACYFDYFVISPFLASLIIH